MKTISAERFVRGVKSIYEEDPEYQLGHDGSDGKCDCIGMPRGALEREGVTTTNMRGTNQAARKTIQNLQPIRQEDLRLGDVVLKTRDPDDPDMPLPDSYRRGGANYNGDLTNYTHIGTVTREIPLEITHMTSPRAKIDTKIGNWKFMGQLPWVERDKEPEPVPQLDIATVWADNGKPVNLRRGKGKHYQLIERVPCGDTVEILDYGSEWCRVRWHDRTGYMMTEFLMFEKDLYRITIQHVPLNEAEELRNRYPDAIMEKE